MKEFTQAYLYWEDELVKLDGYLVNKQGEILGTLWNSKWTEPRILKTHPNQKGYHRVRVNLQSKSRLVAVHRIVASTFINKPNEATEVNHISGNKNDNSVNNLEWTNHSLNIKHAKENGLLKRDEEFCKKISESKKGKPNKNRKLSDDDVRYIKNNYKPRDKKFGANALSEKFNISKSVLYSILRNEYYKDVN